MCKDNYSAASLNVFTAPLEAVGVEIMAGNIVQCTETYRHEKQKVIEKCSDRKLGSWILCRV